MLFIAISVQKIESGDLLIVNGYILGIIRGNDSIYLFDTHNKDEKSNLSSLSIAVVLKIDTLLCTIVTMLIL